MTARFEAEKLWQQGYNGAKVKVGVFDTGIRADHPHVKNIRSVVRLAVVVVVVAQLVSPIGSAYPQVQGWGV